MKLLLTTIASLMMIASVNAQQATNYKNGIGNSTTSINTLDTVVFDISQAVPNGPYIEFPVTVISDDTIVALDFSFKFNQNDLVYDTILDMTSYLQQLSYYNTNDSTVRFTSYSLSTIATDTTLVLVRFDLLNGQLCSNDLHTVKGYLNGDQCSVKVTNCSPTGIDEAVNDSPMISVFPNPSDGIVTVAAEKEALLTVYDMKGAQIISDLIIGANEQRMINFSGFGKGLYFIQSLSGNKVQSQRLIIQ